MTFWDWCVCEKLPRNVLHIPVTPSGNCDLCGLPRRRRSGNSPPSDEEGEQRQRMLAERRRAEIACKGLVRVKVTQNAKKPKSMKCKNCGGVQMLKKIAKPTGISHSPDKVYTARFGRCKIPKKQPRRNKQENVEEELDEKPLDVDIDVDVEHELPMPPSLMSPPAINESIWEQSGDNLPMSSIVAMAHEVFNRPPHLRHYWPNFYSNVFVSDFIPLNNPITNPAGGAISKQRPPLKNSMPLHHSSPLPPLSKVVSDIMESNRLEAEHSRASGGGVAEQSWEPNCDFIDRTSQFSPSFIYEGPSEDALVGGKARSILQPKPLPTDTRADADSSESKSDGSPTSVPVLKFDWLHRPAIGTGCLGYSSQPYYDRENAIKETPRKRLKGSSSSTGSTSSSRIMQIRASKNRGTSTSMKQRPPRQALAYSRTRNNKTQGRKGEQAYTESHCDDVPPSLDKYKTVWLDPKPTFEKSMIYNTMPKIGHNREESCNIGALIVEPISLMSSIQIFPEPQTPIKHNEKQLENWDMIDNYESNNKPADIHNLIDHLKIFPEECLITPDGLGRQIDLEEPMSDLLPQINYPDDEEEFGEIRPTRKNIIDMSDINYSNKSNVDKMYKIHLPTGGKQVIGPARKNMECSKLLIPRNQAQAIMPNNTMWSKIMGIFLNDKIDRKSSNNCSRCGKNQQGNNFKRCQSKGWIPIKQMHHKKDGVTKCMEGGQCHENTKLKKNSFEKCGKCSKNKQMNRTKICRPKSYMPAQQTYVTKDVLATPMEQRVGHQYAQKRCQKCDIASLDVERKSELITIAKPETTKKRSVLPKVVSCKGNLYRLQRDKNTRVTEKNLSIIEKEKQKQSSYPIVNKGSANQATLVNEGWKNNPSNSNNSIFEVPSKSSAPQKLGHQNYVSPVKLPQKKMDKKNTYLNCSKYTTLKPFQAYQASTSSTTTPENLANNELENNQNNMENRSNQCPTYKQNNNNLLNSFTLADAKREDSTTQQTSQGQNYITSTALVQPRIIPNNGNLSSRDKAPVIEKEKNKYKALAKPKLSLNDPVNDITEPNKSTVEIIRNQSKIIDMDKLLTNSSSEYETASNKTSKNSGISSYKTCKSIASVNRQNIGQKKQHRIVRINYRCIQPTKIKPKSAKSTERKQSELNNIELSKMYTAKTLEMVLYESSELITPKMVAHVEDLEDNSKFKEIIIDVQTTNHDMVPMSTNRDRNIFEFRIPDIKRDELNYKFKTPIQANNSIPNEMTKFLKQQSQSFEKESIGNLNFSCNNSDESSVDSVLPLATFTNLKELKQIQNNTHRSKVSLQSVWPTHSPKNYNRHFKCTYTNVCYEYTENSEISEESAIKTHNDCSSLYELQQQFEECMQKPIKLLLLDDGLQTEEGSNIGIFTDQIDLPNVSTTHIKTPSRPKIILPTKKSTKLKNFDMKKIQSKELIEMNCCTDNESGCCCPIDACQTILTPNILVSHFNKTHASNAILKDCCYQVLEGVSKRLIFDSEELSQKNTFVALITYSSQNSNTQQRCIKDHPLVLLAACDTFKNLRDGNNEVNAKIMFWFVGYKPAVNMSINLTVHDAWQSVHCTQTISPRDITECQNPRTFLNDSRDFALMQKPKIERNLLHINFVMRSA